MMLPHWVWIALAAVAIYVAYKKGWLPKPSS
jgi:hypothetical protein